MTDIDRNLLIEQEWTGTFFPPGRQDLAFAGRLRYSPTEGLRLEFAVPMRDADRGMKWSYLHGHTSTGIPLTLVGEFAPDGGGFRFNNGMSYWTSSGYPFHYTVFGHHFKDTDTFDGFDFDISGAQEFFAADSMKFHIPHSDKEIVTAKCATGSLSVIHSSKFNIAGADLRAFFHSENEEALNELQSAYEAILVRHPKFRPFIKKELSYLFRFEPADELTIPAALDVITSVTNLFAMLSFEPAKLLHLSATARDQDGKPHAMSVFPWMINDKATIERCQSSRSYHTIPLNEKDVNLGLLLAEWLDQGRRYSTISSMLQSKVAVTSEHEIHGSIVLAATQLEAIAGQESVRGAKNKYEYGPKNHASISLRRRLSALLGCEEINVGEKISDIRNEIAHVGRPRKLLANISLKNQLAISSILQLIVIGYVLEKIGVSKLARDKYQDTLTSGI